VTSASFHSAKQYNSLQIKFITRAWSHRNDNLRPATRQIHLTFQCIESQEEIVSFEPLFEGW